MTLIHTLRAVILGAAMGLAALPAIAEETFVILDILPLQEGKTKADALAYFEDVEPVLARHGLKRTDVPLNVVRYARGSHDAQVVNLWETDDPDKSFQGIFSDNDYLQHTDNRDSIFDLPSALIIITERVGADH